MPQTSIEWRDAVTAEREAIEERRQKLQASGHSPAFPDAFFGIALSGGGVRSATICLGFLQMLHRYGVFQQADYLSTVSGGGYLGGYIHSRLQHAATTGDDPNLFSEADSERLREGARYLTPGDGPAYARNWIRFLTGIAASILLNSVWILASLLCLALLVAALWQLAPGIAALVSGVLITGAIAVLGYHLAGHPLRQRLPWSSDRLIAFEAALLLGALFYTPRLIGVSAPFLWALVAAGVAGLIGFASNPNVLGLHRFYRDRLADTYLITGGRRGGDLLLSELWVGQKNETPAPYPLINTCVTLLAEASDVDRQGRPYQKGRQAADYFLVSPLYCGSKLTDYANTASSYGRLKLSTAVATSGAAVNPGMGIRTSKILSVLTSLFGIRLGYWVRNPRPGLPSSGWLLDSLSTIPWWPYYHMLELAGRTHSRRPLVNLSDGGNIENLGVYELIRRRCRLIIAFDAAADPAYAFSDLNNLILRVRHELGVDIDFQPTPEQAIRPQPSFGASLSHFVVARLSDLPEKPGREKDWGLLIYVKSSLRKQLRWRELIDFETWFKPGHDYKNNHPAFPHEPTTDQFFDEDQWTAYEQLGQFIAGDLLQQNVRDDKAPAHHIRVADLYDELRKVDSPAALKTYLTPVDKEARKKPAAKSV